MSYFLRRRKKFSVIILLILILGCGSSGFEGKDVNNNSDVELLHSNSGWVVFSLSSQIDNLMSNTGILPGSGSDQLINFDDESVYAEKPGSYSFVDSPTVFIETGDGLRINFSSQGGVIRSVESITARLVAEDKVNTYGFFVRDVISGSDFLHLNGNVISQDNTLVYNVNDTDLGLNLRANFTGLDNRIDVDIELNDTTDTDRAITLYFALPLDIDGWTWGNDIRDSQEIKGTSELRNTDNVDYGANNKISRYPIAAIYGADGIAIGYPLDHPAVIRLVANPGTKQLYIAYDVAISSMTKIPRSVNLKAVIYRFDPKWGFRAAMKKYYEIYPEYFVKRASNEGIWVPFSNLINIPDLQDFGIAYHETLYNDYSFYDYNNIYSFRYLTSPWSQYMAVPGNIPNDDYDQVMAHVKLEYERGNSKAEVTMISGSLNENGKYISEAQSGVSWCSYCVLFTVNPDPDIREPGFILNKAFQTWNSEKKSVYNNTSRGILDGEYIDSLGKDGLDYRESHIRASDLPLTFNKDVLRPAVPLPFANYEFSKWVGDDIHRMNKLIMGNGALRKFPFFAAVFDIMGVEVDWIKDGEFVEPWIVPLMFWRTMSYQKPYDIVTNSDFTQFTKESVESYFKTALFYGMYPSMNFHSAMYWENSAFYERDRYLFKKFIPLIQKLGKAGWEPVTNIKSSEPNIFIERFGIGENLYFTIHNEGEVAVNYDLIIETESLGIPQGVNIFLEDCIKGDIVQTTAVGTTLTITDILLPGDVRMFNPLLGTNSPCSQ